MKKKCDHIVGMFQDIVLPMHELHESLYNLLDRKFKFCPECGSRITLPWEKGGKK
jgi:hypothetical protein